MLTATILTEQERELQIKKLQQEIIDMNNNHGIFGGDQSRVRKIISELNELGQLENELIPYSEWIKQFDSSNTQDIKEKVSTESLLHAFYNKEEWDMILDHQLKLQLVIKAQELCNRHYEYYEEYSSEEFASIDNYRGYLLTLMNHFRPQMARLLHVPTEKDINRINAFPSYNPRVDLPTVPNNIYADKCREYIRVKFNQPTQIESYEEDYLVIRAFEDGNNVYYVFCNTQLSN